MKPAKLKVVRMKKRKIPETAEDIINIDNVNIAEFLAESDQNKIIKVGNSFYAIGGEGIKSHFLTGTDKNNYIYYPCKQALPPPALGIGKHNVYMDKPLFSTSYLAPLADFVLLSEVIAMLESKNKYFEIITTGTSVKDIPATASAQMFTSNANAVGANHCQEGKASKIFKIKIIKIIKIKQKQITKRTKKTAKNATRAKRRRRRRL